MLVDAVRDESCVVRVLGGQTDKFGFPGGNALNGNEDQDEEDG